ncbi:MAG: nuclear transport factor 2 family protein [Pseudomonadales bacterium]
METGQVPDPQQLADRIAIEHVLNVHCRGVDRACVEDLKSAYWPEAEVAYGSFNGRAHEFCEILPQGIQRYRATHHQVSNIIVEQRGEDAVVESYVTAYHHSPEGAATEMTYFGRYVDHMQKRQDVWKILLRYVVMDWNQQLTESADFSSPTFAGLKRSGRKPDDPLYELKTNVFGET